MEGAGRAGRVEAQHVPYPLRVQPYPQRIGLATLPDRVRSGWVFADRVHAARPTRYSTVSIACTLTIMKDASSSSSIKTTTQTKDLRYFTRLLNEKFQNMSVEKKAIVRELGFNGLMHNPPMNVTHKLLKELEYSFNLSKNKLDTQYGDLFPEKVNFKELSEENKELYTRFQGKILKNLTDEMMDIGVHTD
ncbi:hypothetical protein Ahy_A03g011484 [Arachis hypogaea]|uniref:Uncharacterized protein n=1 Tax=Arachis hypogaea TaxID=3818 RepID=A0A445DQV0_ARAHY|nr:hypothetical protein Ahy_A03g011484 [Arachis hypogaea]